MTEKSTDNENHENLDIKTDLLSLKDFDDLDEKPARKTMSKDNGRGYPVQRMRSGRPYYYLVWYEKVNGKRRQRSRYLGTSLPVGYSLGRPVKIDQNRVRPGRR